MLVLKNVKKKYDSEAGEISALHDITIEFPATGLFFVLGKSGSGKTTLINVMSSLDKPNEGAIVFEGEDIIEYDEHQKDNYRNLKIGIIFQEFNLLDNVSVGENIQLALEIIEGQEQGLRERVERVLDYVGLSGFYDRKVKELSGGQKQRVAIARAIIKNPKIIFADEPTGSLDTKTGHQIIELLRKISDSRLVIVISHDEKMAKDYADKIIYLDDGKIHGIDEKKKGKNKYTLRIKKHDVEFYDIDWDEASGLLVQHLEQNEELEFEMKKISEHNPQDEIDKEKDTNVCVSEKQLSRGRILRLVFSNIRRHWIRTAIVFVLLGISLFLTIATGHLCFFNKEKVIEEYLQNQQVKDYYLYYSSKYVNSFFDLKTKELYSGNYVANILSGIDGVKVTPITNRFFIEPDAEMEIDADNDIQYVIFNDAMSSVYRLEKGRWPRNYNEIVLTDYIANSLLGKGKEDIIGTKCCISGIEVNVVGLVSTNYKEYKYDYKKKINKDAAYTEYNGKRRYEIIVIHEKFIDEYCDKQMEIEVDCGNFTMADNEERYLSYGSIDVADVAALKDNNMFLLAGRYPENENEVIVSDLFYERYINKIQTDEYGFVTDDVFSNPMSIYDDFTEQEYRFLDLYDKQTDNYYTDCINLFDYMQQVNVVGVYNSNMDSAPLYSEVLLHHKVYTALMENYRCEKIYTGYAIVNSGVSYRDIVDAAEKNHMKFDEPSIEMIYNFDENVANLRGLLALLLFSLVMISAFIVFLYINSEMNGQMKNIGILRAIGIQKKDTIRMMYDQVQAVICVSLVISVVLDLCMMLVVNRSFVKDIPEKYFNIIIPNLGLCIVFLFGVFTVGGIGALLPNSIINKKDPINIIKM